MLLYLCFSVIFDFYYHCFIVCTSVFMCLHFLCNFVLCAASCVINDDDDDDRTVSLSQSVSTP